MRFVECTYLMSHRDTAITPMIFLDPVNPSVNSSMNLSHPSTNVQFPKVNSGGKGIAFRKLPSHSATGCGDRPIENAIKQFRRIG